MRVVVTATNAVGSTPATSSQTATVAGTAAPPRPTRRYRAISGSTTQGQTLTAANGTWSDGPTSYAYQWRDCDSTGNNCTNISGATSSTYTLTGNDVAQTRARRRHRHQHRRLHPGHLRPDRNHRRSTSGRGPDQHGAAERSAAPPPRARP